MRPPYDSRPPRRPTEATWTGILATTAVVLAVPLVLWAASHTLVAILALATTAGLAGGARRLLRLRRCLADCGGVVVELTDDLRVCVTRDGTGAAC